MFGGAASVSVRGTIAETAGVFWWRAIDVINEETSTVSHLNVDGPIAAVAVVVKADLPGDFPISYCRMSAI